MFEIAHFVAAASSGSGGPDGTTLAIAAMAPTAVLLSQWMNGRSTTRSRASELLEARRAAYAEALAAFEIVSGRALGQVVADTQNPTARLMTEELASRVTAATAQVELITDPTIWDTEMKPYRDGLEALSNYLYTSGDQKEQLREKAAAMGVLTEEGCAELRARFVRGAQKSLAKG